LCLPALARASARGTIRKYPAHTRARVKPFSILLGHSALRIVVFSLPLLLLWFRLACILVGRVPSLLILLFDWTLLHRGLDT
jgi:hypothetical protein